MTKENNKMQVDIENLFKQNVNDLLSIKELYRKLKEVEEKISQIKYNDTTLAYKLKKEYEKLKKIILDENVQAKLANDIQTINTKLTNDIKTINTKLTNDIETSITKANNDIESINSQLDTNTNEIDKLKSDKIKFIAHRGFVALAPENTLKSTEKACENGFSMVEMDVSQTKDYKYILLHDSTIDRTTNGTGGSWLYSFDEIQQFNIDTGVLFEDEILKIPSFEECIEMCSKYRVGVNLDCSKNEYTESNFRYFIQLLKDNNIFNKSCIATNTTKKRLDIMKVDSNTTLLWVSSLANLEVDINESLNYKNVIIGYNSTVEIPDAKQIKILHDNNVKILMYGVNSYENYLKIKNLNIDYIETETIFPNGGAK